MVNWFQRPQGPGIRIDDGFEEGMDIPIYYDPMIGKLVTKGSTRQEAIDRMTRAIDEFAITGIQTTLPFCKYAINHDAFKSGKFDTKFVQNHFSPEVLKNENNEEEEKIAVAMSSLFRTNKKSKPAASNSAKTSNWKKRAWVD